MERTPLLSPDGEDDGRKAAAVPAPAMPGEVRAPAMPDEVRAWDAFPYIGFIWPPPSHEDSRELLKAVVDYDAPSSTWNVKNGPGFALFMPEKSVFNHWSYASIDVSSDKYPRLATIMTEVCRAISTNDQFTPIPKTANAVAWTNPNVAEACYLVAVQGWDIVTLFNEVHKIQLDARRRFRREAS